MTVINLQNVQQELEHDDIVQLEFIYSWKSKKFWRLLQPIAVNLTNGQTIEIPKGFVTDLSSVPRFLWGIAPPFGDFLLAAIIHDFLYTNHIQNRSFCDDEMFTWSNVLNANKLDNFIRWVAVRLFGKRWWDGKVNWGTATS